MYKNIKQDIGTLETLIMWQTKRITSFENVQRHFLLDYARLPEYGIGSL